MTRTTFAPFLGQILKEVGRFVGRHLVEDVGRALFVEVAHDRSLHLGLDLGERFGRRLDVELLEHGAPLVDRHLLDDVGDVRGMQERELRARHGDAHVRVRSRDRLDEMPGDDPAGQLLTR